MDKRDELNRLLRDCQRGLIDRVITKSVSRLAGNTIDILNIVRMLRSIGVSIYFEEQDLDSSAMNFEMFLTMPGMTAQNESMVLSQNLRWGIQKRMEKGDYKLSTPPFGFVLINGQLEVYEPEAVIVRRIFEMYLSGMGKCRIAGILNKEGIPAHNTKGCWHHSTVHYILTNERYMGDALLRKNYRTEDVPFKRMKNHGDVAQYYVENSNPPIVDIEIWQAAQRLSGEKRREYTEVNRDELLARVLKCSDCGHSFIRRVNKDVISWVNRCSFTDVRRCCRKRVREQAVFDAFIRLVLKLKNHIREIIDPVIKYMEVLQLLTNDEAVRINGIDDEISSLSLQASLLSKLYEDGVLTRDDCTARRISINNKLTKLRSEKRRKKKEGDDKLDELRELRNLLKSKDDQWCFDDALFRQIVLEITVVSNAELRFRLIGGLEFTEYIEKSERIKCI